MSVRPPVCLLLCFPAPVIFPNTSSPHTRPHTRLDCIVTLPRLARSGNPASTSSKGQDDATPDQPGRGPWKSIKQASLSQGGG
ncbi:hypothetical protein LX32DRAFT_644206 [Colletotrichum zoysiae]|uniref:Uncharacterized protein n=1 Tax=Colletotrichum zoysiae TaxID=1216348 RepID=A0AAD9LZL9_9PEZI|nr:hypothetical protein LX32DRAFT_644206 [Colletotrichum zoysiae]